MEALFVWVEIGGLRGFQRPGNLIIGQLNHGGLS